MSRTAVVIAAYNEAASIAAIVRAALRWCPRVYVVDDGSSDGTAAAVAGSGAEVLRHADNEGKGASLWDGMQAALRDGADAVVTLDGDGQHDPDDIPRLLECLRRNPAQVVIGARLAQAAAIPPARYYANRFANFWLSWAAGYRIADSQSGFRVYPAALLRRLDPRLRASGGFVFESEVLIEAARLGYRSSAVAIDAVYRDGARPSHFRAVVDVLRITRMVAAKLLRSRLNLRGLWNVLAGPSLQRLQVLGKGAPTTLLLSFGLMGLSLGASWCWVLGRVLYFALRVPADVAAGDVLLVPGLALRDGAVSDGYARRLERARRLLVSGHGRRVVVLGGRAERGSGISEAQAGRAYLCARGIAPARISVEESSRNTLENLRHGRALLASGERVILISSRTHLARCHALASALGIAHQLCAAEACWRWRPAGLWALFKESLHLHWYYSARLWARLTADAELLSKTS